MNALVGVGVRLNLHNFKVITPAIDTCAMQLRQMWLTYGTTTFYTYDDRGSPTFYTEYYCQSGKAGLQSRTYPCEWSGW